VGRNYAEHARELGNPVPDEPLLFMKPATALADLASPILLPRGLGAVHHEVELALLIGRELRAADRESAAAAISGVGIALDLTLRDLQDVLKRKGHPWERAKAFDDSCPLSPFIPVERFAGMEGIGLSLSVNGQLRQQGSSAEMVVGIADLVSHMSSCFTLLPGDVVLTGTPAGVGPLNHGDHLEFNLDDRLVLSTRVA
jgi:2-keto-4-pentenoate hydratase/2-oxohepta-3-ene-1,7-dioic acid hydratase in catechol pathway